MHKFCYITALIFALGAIGPPISTQDRSEVFLRAKTEGFSASSIDPIFVNANFAQSQKSAEVNAGEQTEMANRVRQQFLHAWNVYKQFAWGHDELRPLSKSYRDWYSVSLYMSKWMRWIR